MSDLILLERDGAVARVTLNRPERLNAFTLAMWEDLGAVMAEVNRDDQVRCVVLSGAGGKAFGAGADIAEFRQVRYDAEQARGYARVVDGALEALEHCPYPVVASIAGPCMGGGLELALLCDLRICGAEEAMTKGLVTRAVPDEALEAETGATAGRIASGAPLAARWHKRFVRRTLDPAPLTEAERREPFESCDTADYREGIRAFLAKETPVFEGK